MTAFATVLRTTFTASLFCAVKAKINFTLMIILGLSFLLSSCSTSADTINPQSTTEYSAARESVSLLNTDGFEQNQLANFWYKELWATNAGNISTALARVGKQSMRFGWSPSQFNGTNNSCHAELATAQLTEQENERWYGFSLYMPAANMADDQQVVNLTQWHAYPEPGYEGTVPPVNLELQPGNKLSFVYRSSNVAITKHLQSPTAQKTFSLGTASYDRWVDFVVHIKWDPTGTQGSVQVWQDGQLKVNEQNVSVGYVKARNFWKIGLYCYSGKATNSERVAYFDEVRMGGPSSSYQDVRPGRTNGTAR